MSRRLTSVLASSACVIALVTACSWGGGADGPAGSSASGRSGASPAPRDFEATFEVEDPLGLVAGTARPGC